MTERRKVAIISGGMGGVGFATAVTLAREHYRIAILYKNSSDKELEDAGASVPGEHLFIRCDMTKEQEVERVMNEIVSQTDQIDVAVHTAVDPIKREKILNMNESAFRGQFEAGFFGAHTFLRPIAKIMKGQKHGTLIGITSTVIESDSTPARMGSYTVGKIALRGLLRELHRELSPSGIRVFAVAPDLMRTRLNADLPEKFFEMIEARSGDNALMLPEDVAEAIIKLCTDTTISSGVSYLVSSGKTTPL